jgi:hypothetical protein
VSAKEKHEREAARIGIAWRLVSTLTAARIDQNGGDSRNVKYVELPGSATANPIVAGRVDAGMLSYPVLGEAEAG